MPSTHNPLAGLADTFGDRLVTPGKPGFATLAATVFDGERRVPSAVVRPRSTAEVAAVVRTARDHGLRFTVRSGGHSYSRASLADGVLLIDLRLMDEVLIDPKRLTGSAQGGVTAGRYTAAAGEHGLATGFGDTGGVGVTGITLGGGIGYLSRRDGLTIDNLLGAQVVLPDGTVTEVGPDDEPDIYWALRGGGAGLGVVVTRMDFRLTPTGAVVGGVMLWRAEPRILTDVAAALAHAPDELGGMVNAMQAPPMPMIPAELHGTPVVAARVCWSGDVAAADDALAPLRTHAPLVELVEPAPYTAMFEGGPDHAGMHVAGDTGFTDVPGEREAAAMLDMVAAGPGHAVINLRPMGGAIARVDADDTAFGHRHQAVMTTLSGLTPEVDKAPAVREWAADGARSLGLDTGPAYVNFMTSSTAAGRDRCYPEAVGERLRAVRRRLGTDPGLSA